MIARYTIIGATITITLTGCVNARFNVPKSVSPSHPVASSILPGIESASLNASLVLPRSYYAVLNKDFTISVAHRTIVTATIDLPPESLSDNAIILTNITGKLTFSKSLKVKKAGLPAVAISEAEVIRGSNSANVRFDIFQTFLAIILNAGGPRSEGEKPLSAQQILPCLTLTNFDLKLRSGHQWRLPGQSPLSLVTEGQNQMSFSSLNWTDTMRAKLDPNATRGAELLMHFPQLEGINAQGVAFRGRGDLCLNAKTLQLNASGKVSINGDRAALKLPLGIQGRTGEPMLLFAGSSAPGARPAIALKDFQLVQGDWKLALDEFGLDIESLAIKLAGDDPAKSAITALLHGRLAGNLQISKQSTSASALADPVLSDLRIETNGFTFSVSKGIHLADVALKATNGNSSVTAQLKDVNIGPVAVSGNSQVVSLVTVSNAGIVLTQFNVAGSKGSFRFDSPTGAFLQTTGVLAFSSDKFCFPTTTVQFQDARIQFADPKSTATIAPITLQAELRDPLGDYNISGKAAAVASARVQVADTTLTDVRAEAQRFLFECTKTNLNWDIQGGRFGLNWQPILNYLQSKPLKAPIPANAIHDVHAVFVQALSNTGGELAVFDLKVEPIGDGSNPKLNLSGRGVIKLDIHYKRPSLQVHIEHKRKIFGWKPPVPKISVGWAWTDCRLDGGFLARFRDGAIRAKAADTLRDTSIAMTFAPQSQLLAGFLPVGGCDVFLDIESLALQALLIPLEPVCSGLALFLFPIEIKPFENLPDKWNDARLTKLELGEWNRNNIEIDFDGHGNIPLK